MKTNMRGEYKRVAALAVWEPRREEIEELYHLHNWSQKAMADYFGVSQTAMTKVLRRLEITSLGRGRTGVLNGRYKDGSESTLYRLLIQKDKCSECPAVDRLVVHHKNFDHQDNHLENLQVLCESCHNRLHKTEWWSRHKSLLQTPLTE
ncbi:MAG: HNH endonuclease [Candidatus Nanopelagicales bacterium]|nr:HNH endonuclease [Candidatus Nanopelagicales bacterium]